MKEELSKRWEEAKFGHDTPSPETRERLKALETNQLNYIKQMEDFKKDNNDSHNELKEMIKELENKIDCVLNKKADIWVEKAVTWGIYFIATGLFGVIGTLIYQAIIHFKV